MARRILVLQGHPTPGGGHFGNALAEAYIRGAMAGGHEVREIVVTELEFPILRSKAEWEEGPSTDTQPESPSTLAEIVRRTLPVSREDREKIDAVAAASKEGKS